MTRQDEVKGMSSHSRQGRCMKWPQVYGVSAAAVERTVAELERAVKAQYPEVRRLYLAARPESDPTVADQFEAVHGRPAPVASAASGKSVPPARGNYPPPKPKKGKKGRR